MNIYYYSPGPWKQRRNIIYMSKNYNDVRYYFEVVLYNLMSQENSSYSVVNVIQSTPLLWKMSKHIYEHVFEYKGLNKYKLGKYADFLNKSIFPQYDWSVARYQNNVFFQSVMYNDFLIQMSFDNDKKHNEYQIIKGNMEVVSMIPSMVNIIFLCNEVFNKNKKEHIVDAKFDELNYIVKNVRPADIGWMKYVNYPPLCFIVAGS